MATQYTITYTKTNRSNIGLGTTPQSHTVGISGFTISGDTNRVIGKIISIRFEHWNSESTEYATWKFSPKLNFSDGTQWAMASVSKDFRGDSIKSVHTATSGLPTVAQIRNLTGIYIYYKCTGGNTSTSKIYWRATNDQPMKLVITFEEAPVYYGDGDEWKTCQIYYGDNGEWVQVLPYYGDNGEWKQV